MAYSTAFSQAITIILVINAKMEELRYEFVSAKLIAECLIDYIVKNQQVDDIKSKIMNHLQDAEKAMKESLEKTTLADLF